MVKRARENGLVLIAVPECLSAAVVFHVFRCCPQQFGFTAVGFVPLSSKKHAKTAMPRFCSGLAGKNCVFSTSHPGTPARPAYGRRTCIFCDLTSLQAELDSESGRTGVIRRLAVAWQNWVSLRPFPWFCIVHTSLFFFWVWQVWLRFFGRKIRTSLNWH